MGHKSSAVGGFWWVTRVVQLEVFGGVTRVVQLEVFGGSQE